MKKMTRYFTLKTISIVLISLLLAMTAIQIGSMLKIKSDVLKIQALWDAVQIEQSEKLRLENSIRTFLGFNGMIHQLKDAILSGDVEKIANAKSDIHSIETIIELYLSFQLSSAERYALHDISMVIEKYKGKIDELASLFKQNLTKQQLDQFMRVDDEPALRGLEVLKQYNVMHPSHGNLTHMASPDKFVLLTQLVADLGYGGLIHNIKNLELRNDPFYATESQSKIEALNNTIQAFHSVNLTVQEQASLKNLTQSIHFYQATLTNLSQPITEQNPISLAQRHQADKDVQKTLQILHQHIEIELKNKIFQVGDKIYSIQSTINTLIKLIIILSLTTLLFFAYIMFNKVITPLRKVTASMVLLARQRKTSNIYFSENQILEIKQIIRSIRVFRKNENKRHNSEKSLKKMNITTLQQLNEIKELQNKSEQKTEQALTLANHLTELQKSAEFDRKNALDSQRRVKTILNTVHDAIITTNSLGIIESINTATVQMLGYQKSELLGRNITILMPTHVADKHPQFMQNYNNQENPRIRKTGLEQEIKRADDSTFPVEIFLGQSEFNKERTFTAVIRDITQRKKDEEAIQHLVLTDPLTNLANRRHFNQELKRAMENKQRLQLSVGLLMIDLDDFKPINDTFGHNVGDKVLQRVASRLLNVTRNVDLIARLGGDEFAIILNSVNDLFDPVTPAKKIIQTLSKPMNIDGKMVQIGTTIGIAISPQDAMSLEEFINRADKALYKAKDLGKGQCFSYQDLSENEK